MNDVMCVRIAVHWVRHQSKMSALGEGTRSLGPRTGEASGARGEEWREGVGEHD